MQFTTACMHKLAETMPGTDTFIGCPESESFVFARLDPPPPSGQPEAAGMKYLNQTPDEIRNLFAVSSSQGPVPGAISRLVHMCFSTRFLECSSSISQSMRPIRLSSVLKRSGSAVSAWRQRQAVPAASRSQTTSKHHVRKATRTDALCSRAIGTECAAARSSATWGMGDVVSAAAYLKTCPSLFFGYFLSAVARGELWQWKLANESAVLGRKSTSTVTGKSQKSSSSRLCARTQP